VNEQRFIEIMEADYKYDDSIECYMFLGIEIMRKYIKSAGFMAAEHDIIYSCGIEELIDAGITDQDVMSLRCLGWFMDEECLAHFS